MRFHFLRRFWSYIGRNDDLHTVREVIVGDYSHFDENEPQKSEIDLNHKLVELLTNHGIETIADDEFVYPDLSSKIKIKTRAIYTAINNTVSSQLDVMVITEKGQKILESFGDIGQDLDDAIVKNLTNFSMSSLHLILAAFGSGNEEILDTITIEDWQINDDTWQAYIGNIVPKTNNKNTLTPPPQFFEYVEKAIRLQDLSDDLHWFRGYYLQHNEVIYTAEFLMDNEDITSTIPFFSSIPVLPDVNYYSCRNFIILKRK